MKANTILPELLRRRGAPERRNARAAKRLFRGLLKRYGHLLRATNYRLLRDRSFKEWSAATAVNPSVCRSDRPKSLRIRLRGEPGSRLHDGLIFF